MTTWFFWAFATVAIVASLVAVWQRRAIVGVLMLVTASSAVAGLYVLLDSPLMAVIQLGAYTAGLAALFLPVLLVLDLPGSTPDSRAVPKGIGLLVVGTLVVELAWAFQRIGGAELPRDDAAAVSAGAVFARLWTDHLPTLAVVVLLGATTVAGAHLVWREGR